VIDRRKFITGTAATFAGLSAPFASTLADVAAPKLPTRPIPSTGEALPIIGLGNSVAFRSDDESMTRQLLELLIEKGGAYVDVAGGSRSTVARAASKIGAGDRLFLGTYSEETDDVAVRTDLAGVRAILDDAPLDLVLTRYVEDFAKRSKEFRALKDEGIVRYVGVARSSREYYPAIMQLMKSGALDFVQVNYSLLETEAENELLPLAQEKGIAIVVNRPFINGDYFSLVKGRTLPGWVVEFDCKSWAQFSLKFILGNPAVNCVLTETANPKHALDNLDAGFGRLPDVKARKRMRQIMQDLV
jgi:aryl-alcohol dehydrogenase-like predicted oxidoreductase